MKIVIEIPDQVYKEDPSYKRYFEGLQMMVNRMAVSHYKYGVIDNHDGNVDEVRCGLQRLSMYDDSLLDADLIWEGATRKKLNTGNTENLLDAANFMLIEFIMPQHAKAKFKSQTSEQSPGLTYVND
jgi:hypothetical protein